MRPSTWFTACRVAKNEVECDPRKLALVPGVCGSNQLMAAGSDTDGVARCEHIHKAELFEGRLPALDGMRLHPPDGVAVPVRLHRAVAGVIDERLEHRP